MKRTAITSALSRAAEHVRDSFVVDAVDCVEVIMWLKRRTALKESDKDNVAVTLKEPTDNGRVRVWQMLFNQRSNKVVDGCMYDVDALGEEFQALHRDKDMVIWE